MQRAMAVAAVAALPWLCVPTARAAEDPCHVILTAERAVGCALALSPEVREQRARLDAVAGRRITAGLWLPSNPVVSVMLAQRKRPAPEAATVANWNVVLSQEIEIAGQRGRRLDVVDAEAAAQVRRVAVAEHEVAAAAASAWLEVVAARELATFAAELAQTADALASAAEGRARDALVAGVEADVARAEAIRIGAARLEVERRASAARIVLASLVGVTTEDIIVGDALPPPSSDLPAVTEASALELRGELAASEMERRVLERRVALLRRERIPSVRVSAFLERGEISDRVVGMELAIPLPLPAPVGRTRAGEIAAALAEVRAAESSTDAVRRRIRIELRRADAALQTRRAASLLYRSDLLGRARVEVAALRESLVARQLSVREALVLQRSLIELLVADIEARLATALAEVELRRAAGMPIIAVKAGGTP